MKNTNLSEVIINFVVSVDMQYPYRLIKLDCFQN